MADAGPASPLLDDVSAILRSVSCGRVCTVPMRPGKGVENCVNTKDIVAGMAARARGPSRKNEQYGVPRMAA
jgi:hypothetical protein